MTAITTKEQAQQMINEARTAALEAARVALAQYGDRDACGFAWTNIAGVKGSTKLGRVLSAAGLRKDWTGKNFQLWNPSGLGVQSIGILEAGADAAAEVFRKYGLDAYAGSRMD